jgi:HSP20 family protein
MADIAIRSPFAEMRRALDRMWEDMPSFGNGVDEGMLALDIAETPDEILVKASLPGFKADEIDVRVDNGVLSIKADHTEEKEERGEHYYRRERHMGSLSRRVALPGIVSDADVQAELEDGVLKLHVPRREEAKPKRIEVKTG